MAAAAHADERSDVFSLGATLYEALTLERPFPGDTPQQVLDAIQYRDPRDPRSFRSRVPAELSWIMTLEDPDFTRRGIGLRPVRDLLR